MEVRFALVLDRDVGLDLDHWRASAVAATRATLRLEHDGHVILLPRRPGDRRVEDVVARRHPDASADQAGVYELAPFSDPAGQGQ
jgi:hypothetical protein